MYFLRKGDFEFLPTCGKNLEALALGETKVNFTPVNIFKITNR